MQHEDPRTIKWTKECQVLQRRVAFIQKQKQIIYFQNIIKSFLNDSHKTQTN